MLRKVKHIIAAATLVFTFSALTQTLKVEATTISQLGVTPVVQAKSNWCWAASADMAGGYNPRGTRTQYDVVKYVKGGLFDSYPDVPGSPVDAAKGAKYASYDAKVFYYQYSAFTLS